MDHINPESGRSNQQTSSIPRLSRLPVPRSSRAPASGIPAPPGSTVRQPQSQSSLRQPAPKSSLGARPNERQPFSKSVNSGHGSLVRPTIMDDNIFKKPASRPTSRDTNSTISSSSSGNAVLNSEDGSAVDKPVKRRPRPSLSERTMETLAQIPPSPASARRKSSFQVADSPLRPSSRPASALSMGRPQSAAGSRSSSPTKSSAVPSVPRIPAVYGTNLVSGTKGERGTSLKVAAPTSQSQTNWPTTGSHTPTKPSTSVPRASLSGNQNTQSSVLKPQSGNRTSRPTTLASTFKTGSVTNGRNTAKPVSTGRSSTVKSPGETSQSNSKGSPAASAAKSSASLRETIAKAKAAAAAKGNKPSNMGGDGSTFMPEASDASSMQPKLQSGNTGLMRKRVQAARTGGHLNIAAMGLKQIPDEVMKMYDFDPTTSSDWAESVDLSKLIAADNELVDLREDAFPDLSMEDLVDSEEDVNLQFAGLEILDLHGNQLQIVPMGLRRLQRLQVLNFASNNLELHVFDILSMITSLKDLNLSSNKLDGPIPETIGELRNLQSLNLRGNKLTEIPNSIASLSQLRKLDVSSNVLVSFPFSAVTNTPLTELNVSSNRLAGTLFGEATSMPNLLNLDASKNALEELGEGDSIDLPRLQTLHCDVNRLSTLPQISGWNELRTLTASENSLSAFPAGMTALNSLKSVDLSNNNISKIESQIAFMDDLILLRLDGNPIRERKFLTMSAADLKQDLRKKFEPLGDPGDDEGQSATVESVMSMRSAASGYAIKNGVLDLSSKALTEVDLSLIPDDANIRELKLASNKLTAFPIELLNSCAETLRTLDLSRNPFGAAIPSENLTLPLLSSLNLSSTNLSTLDILHHLAAPALTDIDISINRLRGPFPSLRPYFPNLTTINASDNQFSHLPVSSAKGLTSLNLQNNELQFLEPKLGLLKELRMLEVRGNVFRVPRWDLLEKGTTELMKWLAARIPEGDKELE